MPTPMPVMQQRHHPDHDQPARRILELADRGQRRARVAITSGATATIRAITRVLFSDALAISLTVQPIASADAEEAGGDRRQVRQPLAEQRHVHVDHRRGHQQAEGEVDPLQRAGPKGRGRQHRRRRSDGRRRGTPRPARAPTASSAAVARHAARDTRDADRQRRRAEQQQRPHGDAVAAPPGRRCAPRGQRERAPARPSPRSGSTSTPNAQRHEPNWANRPPAAGPTSVPTPHIADTSADALVHNDCGSAELMTA